MTLANGRLAPWLTPLRLLNVYGVGVFVSPVAFLLKAVERFGDVSDRLKASGQTFEESKQKAASAVVRFNEAKQRRCVFGSACRV